MLKFLFYSGERGSSREVRVITPTHPIPIHRIVPLPHHPIYLNRDERLLDKWPMDPGFIT